MNGYTCVYLLSICVFSLCMKKCAVIKWDEKYDVM